MKRLLVPCTVLVIVASAASAQAATCTPTGFVRDGINMTAAVINPVASPGVVNAAGCNIGIYIDHNMPGGTVTLNKVDVYGANYFGILVNGDAGSVNVNITGALVHNIGEVPFNGAQHGVAIYVRAFFAGNVVTGEISGNTIWAYQKGGIVVNGQGGKISKVTNNRVIGQGHVPYIAQNGIQVGYGAMPYPSQVANNAVYGNSYIGTPGDGSSSAGVLVVGGPWLGTCPDGNVCPYTKFVLVAQNLLFNNDTGVTSFNADENNLAPATPTTVLVLSNIVGSDFCYNQAYQAGIGMLGHTDYIYSNYIAQGGGYGPACGLGIDLEGSINPQVSGNNVTPTMGLALRAEAIAPAVRPQPIE